MNSREYARKIHKVRLVKNQKIIDTYFVFIPMKGNADMSVKRNAISNTVVTTV